MQSDLFSFTLVIGAMVMITGEAAAEVDVEPAALQVVVPPKFPLLI